jgi:transcriptional regulator with XRE-family HTH domain
VPELPVGLAIAKRRHVLGLSQAELARQVGVARDTVSMWERDKQFPHRHLGKLEHVLGVRLTAGEEADPRELRINDLADELGVTPRVREQWIETYRQGDRRAG